LSRCRPSHFDRRTVREVERGGRPEQKVRTKIKSTAKQGQAENRREQPLAKKCLRRKHCSSKGVCRQKKTGKACRWVTEPKTWDGENIQLVLGGTYKLEPKEV